MIKRVVSFALHQPLFVVLMVVLFIGGGTLMAALSLLSILLPETRQMGLETKVSSS